MILVVVYPTRGRYPRFPTSYTVRVGKLRTGLYFETVRPWEHADRIRSGELAELAPLLVLCEAEPTEAVLREARELILGLAVERKTRAEMLSVAVTVGMRYFAPSLVRSVFREEIEMLKEASIVEEWIGEARDEGRVEGRVEDARELLLRLLRAKFGELPEVVVARVQQAEPEWCHEVAERLLTATSLAELGL